MNESAIQQTAGFLPWIVLGDFRIQSYFVVISLVLCLCAWWIPSRAEKREMPGRRALDLFLVAMIGGLLGSRLLHIFWEEPAYYFESPWLVFDVMSGGFVWYGGALGAGLSIAAFLKFSRGSKYDVSLLRWLDFFAPVTAFGYAGGRFACVLTGCCYGRVCDLHDHLFRFPTQGLAVVWELGVAFLLLRFETHSTVRTRKIGFIFFTWMTLHGVGRILMEVLRGDPRGPAYGPITISLLISIILVSVGLAGLVRGRVSK